jgi:glucose-1-phosphate thymidylyltransferase
MKNIGIIPAAGLGTRLSILPFSKELFPITYLEAGLNRNIEIRMVIEFLINSMKIAEVNNLLIIINREKLDILKYLNDGAKFTANISYLLQEKRSGMPDALDLGFPWLNEDVKVFFGMPDTIFTPENAFTDLTNFNQETNADLSLGLFPTEFPHKYGMVKFDSDNRFIYTIDKPDKTELKFMWGIAVWNYKFSKFMHEFLQTSKTKTATVLGAVFQAAHEAGLSVNVLPFRDGSYTDIGTPEELIRTMCLLNSQYMQKSNP